VHHFDIADFMVNLDIFVKQVFEARICLLEELIIRNDCFDALCVRISDVFNPMGISTLLGF